MKTVLNVMKKVVLTICVVVTILVAIGYAYGSYLMNHSEKVRVVLDDQYTYMDENGNENECNITVYDLTDILSSEEVKAN